MEKPRSHFEKVVYLRSWWLDTSGKGFDGKQLVVAGFSNREKEARRVFISAPILKRHDDFNLQTVDGISIRLHGFIDKARTEANGFSSKIFQHFLFGFPAWWEECAKKCVKKEYTTEFSTENNTGIEAASPQDRGIIEDGKADEDIMRGCLDSSTADKDQYLSGETVLRNHSSVSNFEKQDAKQGEATVTPKPKKIRKIDLASATINENLFSRDAEKKLAHVNESNPVLDTVPIVFPEAATFRRWQPEHETANEDILPGCLDSPNADKDQYLSGENVWSNHSSDSNIERQDAKQAEATAKPKQQKRIKKFGKTSRNSRSVKNDMTSAGKSERSATANVNLSRREAEKKSAHLNESTPDTVPIVSPDAASFRRLRSGCLDSSNADKDKYPTGDNVRRNLSSDSNIERQDAKQEETMTKKTKKQKRMKKFVQASRNSRSVENDSISAGKRKRSATANVNLSRREAVKKSAHVNESTPVQDRVPILSPEAASFRRSRSGRLLLPALEYWHNQRAVYDVDRKIIGLKGVLDH